MKTTLNNNSIRDLTHSLNSMLFSIIAKNKGLSGIIDLITDFPSFEEYNKTVGPLAVHLMKENPNRIKLNDNDIRLIYSENKKLIQSIVPEYIVRMAIMSLPNLNSSQQIRLNEFAMPIVLNFEDTIHLLKQELLFTATIDEQAAIINNLSTNRPEFKLIFTWFNLDKIYSSDSKEHYFQACFFNMFVNPKLKFIHDWKANFKTATASYFKDNEYYVDVNKVRQLSFTPIKGKHYGKFEKQNFLLAIGVPDSTNTELYSRNEIRVLHSFITSQSEDFPMEYIFEKEGLKVNKEISSMANAYTRFHFNIR